MTEQLIAKQLYEQLCQGMLTKDTDRLTEILAENFILVHITGVKQTKKDWLAAISSEAMRHFTIEVESLVSQTKGGNLLVRAQNKVDARIYGSRHIWPLQLDVTIEQVAGKWLITRAIGSIYTR